MNKGKFGVSVVAIAVIVFAFGMLKQPQSVLLIAGFALLAEKDEWLNRQVIQALLLILTYYIGVFIVDLGLGGLTRGLIFLELYKAGEAISKVSSFILGALSLALTVISILAILKVLKGKDAELPFLSKIIKSNITSSAGTNYNHQQNASEARPQYTTRSPESRVEEVPYEEPSKEPATAVCPSCSAPIEEGASFCTNCGTKIE